MQNQLTMLTYDTRWYGLIYSVQIGLFICIGLQGGRSDFDIKEWFSSAQGGQGMCPLRSWEICFFETGIVQFGFGEYF